MSSSIYLDNNATTPPLPEVVEIVARVMRDCYGNPGSPHRAGRQARQVLEESREEIAGWLGANPKELIFTSGGTEANNLALRGLTHGLAGTIAITPGEHPDYAEFKAALYERIDPRFREYFGNRPKAMIRLDEIRRGGVHGDGIPPLKNPKMTPARQATYLQDDNIVFGVAIDGDVRAYPRRILAWHEMVKDRISPAAS